LVISCLLAGLLLPGAATAHPHVFVDTGLRIVLDDQGRVAGVEVVWAYDALYSMLTFEDMGLDPDYDGKLEPTEFGQLIGFDLKWIDGFEGDLYLEAGGKTLALGPPAPRALKVEDARIVSTHFRSLLEPVGAGGLILRAYDPTYYTAYDLTRGVEVNGPCVAQVKPADLDAAYTLVEEVLYVTPARPGEDVFPEVGEAFADPVVIACPG